MRRGTPPPAAPSQGRMTKPHPRSALFPYPTAFRSVAGTVTVSASATDNVGVVGVQFKLDGVNLGAEITRAPYTLAWITSTASNGTHSLTAVARDAAGNTGTSSSVTVTVTSLAF